MTYNTLSEIGTWNKSIIMGGPFYRRSIIRRLDCTNPAWCFTWSSTIQPNLYITNRWGPRNPFVMYQIEEVLLFYYGKSRHESWFTIWRIRYVDVGYVEVWLYTSQALHDFISSRIEVCSQMQDRSNCQCFGSFPIPLPEDSVLTGIHIGSLWENQGENRTTRYSVFCAITGCGLVLHMKLSWFLQGRAMRMSKLGIRLHIGSHQGHTTIGSMWDEGSLLIEKLLIFDHWRNAGVGTSLKGPRWIKFGIWLEVSLKDSHEVTSLEELNRRNVME